MNENTSTEIETLQRQLHKEKTYFFVLFLILVLALWGYWMLERGYERAFDVPYPSID